MVPKILSGHSETIKWYRMSYLAYWTSNLLSFVLLELCDSWDLSLLGFSHIGYQDLGSIIINNQH